MVRARAMLGSIWYIDMAWRWYEKAKVEKHLKIGLLQRLKFQHTLMCPYAPYVF